MIKNILRKAKMGIVVIASALLCVTVPSISNVRAAVEGGTDIWLKVQTKEIDIDDIPDDRIVNLDISIENNPKIDIIGFLMEKDSNLEFNGYDVFENIHKGIGGSSHRRFDDNSNILYNEVIFGIYANEDNGTFVKVKLKIPDSAKSGDFYSLKLLTSYDGVNPCIGLVSPESKIIYGSEYFGGFEDGGIRITDNTPVEPVQNDPEPQSEPDQPSVQPVQEQNNGSSVQTNNNNVVGQPTASITTVTVSQTAPMLTSSVTTINTKKVTKSTSVSTSVSTEYMETETVDSTHTDNTDIVTHASDKNNEKSKTKIIILVAVIAVVVASVLAIVIKNNNKKRRENNEK